MTNTKMLIGSLSNDLFRVASLAQRGSISGAIRFLTEAKRWSEPLKHQTTIPLYIQNIASKVSQASSREVSPSEAELYLMYGILLQNYVLHTE